MDCYLLKFSLETTVPSEAKKIWFYSEKGAFISALLFDGYTTYFFLHPYPVPDCNYKGITRVH